MLYENSFSFFLWLLPLCSSHGTSSRRSLSSHTWVIVIILSFASFVSFSSPKIPLSSFLISLTLVKHLQWLLISYILLLSPQLPNHQAPTDLPSLNPWEAPVNHSFSQQGWFVVWGAPCLHSSAQAISSDERAFLRLKVTKLFPLLFLSFRRVRCSKGFPALGFFSSWGPLENHFLYKHLNCPVLGYSYFPFCFLSSLSSDPGGLSGKRRSLCSESPVLFSSECSIR